MRCGSFAPVCSPQRKRELEADEAASKKIRKKEYMKKGQQEKKWARQSSKTAGEDP